MVCASVYMSGAGMSCAGPMSGRISLAKRRVMRSSSLLDMRFGSQITPPLAPPKGTFTVAVFQVIQTASALTRSEEHTSELQSRRDLVCRLLLEKKKKILNMDEANVDQQEAHGVI